MKIKLTALFVSAFLVVVFVAFGGLRDSAPRMTGTTQNGLAVVAPADSGRTEPRISARPKVAEKVRRREARAMRRELAAAKHVHHKRRRWLASTQAKQERKRSRTEFAALNPS